MNPLAEIVNRPWYIDQAEATNYAWAIKALMDGRVVFEANRKDFEPIIQSVPQSSSRAESRGNQSKSRSGQIAIIPIQGPLMKKDQYCGPAGMDTIGRYIKELDKNPDIDAIILDINSPGGTVSGTALLGKTIKNASKPIIAYVNELAASAAYWLASQADEIIAADEKAQIGSIGVMLSFVDIQPAWELQGVKFHSIVSDLSEEKNKLFEEVRKGNYTEYRKEVLNPLAERFINTVKGTRAEKITDESIFKGRVDFADKALEIGLIDSIGSLDFAIERAYQIAETKGPKASHNKEFITNQTNSLSMKKYPAIFSALGIEALEMTDEGSFLNEAQLDKLEEALTGNQAQVDKIAGERDQAIADLTAAQTAHEEEVKTLGSQITSLNEQVIEKDNQIAAIRKNGGEQSASQSIVAKKDPEQQEGNEFLNGFKACGGDTVKEMEYLRAYKSKTQNS